MSSTINVLLIGDTRVGKTSLANAIHMNKKPTSTKPTLGIDYCNSFHSYKDGSVEIKTWEVSADNVTILLSLDTTFEYVLLCTDYDIRKTFKKLEKVHSFLALTICKSSEFILMCCKTDVLSSFAPNEFNYFLKSLHKRADKLKVCCVLTSAETGFFVSETRKMIISSVINQIPPKMSFLKIIQEIDRSQYI